MADLQDYDYVECLTKSGKLIYLPVPKGTTCQGRPSLTDASARRGEALDTKPNQTNFETRAKACPIPVIKKRELFVGRNAYGSVSFYASGSGKLRMEMIGLNGAATPNPSIKEMTEVLSENTRPELFTGQKGYGSLFGNIANGNYAVSLIDEDNERATANIVVTDTGPVSMLFRAASLGGGSVEVKVVGRFIEGPTNLSEGVGGTYALKETLSDDTVRYYDGDVVYTLVDGPNTLSINATTGNLAFPANSITENRTTKVRAAFDGQTIDKLVALTNNDATSTPPPVSSDALQGILETLVEPARINRDRKIANQAGYIEICDLAFDSVDQVNREIKIKNLVMSLPRYDHGNEYTWMVWVANDWYTPAEAFARPWPALVPIRFDFWLTNTALPKNLWRSDLNPNDTITVIAR